MTNPSKIQEEKVLQTTNQSEWGITEKWERVRTKLRIEFGDAAFNSWLKPLSLADSDSQQIVLSAPTRFMRDWISAHYGERVRHIWQSECQSVHDVDIIVHTVPKSASTLAQAQSLSKDQSLRNGQDVIDAEPDNGPSRQDVDAALVDEMIPFSRATDAADSKANNGRAPALDTTVISPEIGSPLDNRFRFERFVVGKSNELAYAAAKRVAENQEVQFNPLFLYGGVGLGKTHLMHAISWHIRERAPHRRVLYLSAERFMYQFIQALKEKESISFKQKFRSVDILMIDDVQFFSRKDSTQEEFFHTFNALVDQNKQIVISADRSPSDLEDIEERIRSRLGWGLVADIHQTDYELRLGILHAKLEQSGSNDISPKVLEFLAHRISSNIRELEGALNRLLAYSNLVGRPVTLEMVQEVLQDLLRANDRRISIEEIQKKVAAHYNIRLTDMHSARRARNVARPRQVAMFLSKQLTTRSLPEIGRRFGGRDHTTVMHAVRRIEELRQTDSTLAEDLDLLKRALEG